MEQITDNGVRPAATAKPTKDRSAKWRRVAFIISGLLCLISIGVNIIVNLAVNGALTWSLYPIIANVFALALLTPLLAKKSSTTLWLAVLSVFTPIFLFLLDRITPGQSWFISLALPIYAIVAAVIWICFFISRRLKSGWYIAALIVLVSGVIVSPVANLMILDFTSQFSPVSTVFTYISIISTVISCTVISAALFGIGYKRRRRFAQEHRPEGRQWPV